MGSVRALGRGGVVTWKKTISREPQMARSVLAGVGCVDPCRPARVRPDDECEHDRDVIAVWVGESSRRRNTVRLVPSTARR